MLTAAKSSEALPHYWQPHETFRDTDGNSIIEVRNNWLFHPSRSRLMANMRTSRRHSTNEATPTLHAFAHALSSILAYLRETAEAIPPELQASPGADARLAALWTRYEDMESVLQALAALCGRVCTYMRAIVSMAFLLTVSRMKQRIL